jgi:hypothetical protein
MKQENALKNSTSILMCRHSMRQIYRDWRTTAAENRHIHGRCRRACVALVSWLLCVCLASSAWTQPPKLLEVDVPGGRFVGLPVHWSDFDAVVLETTGHLHIIDQAEVRGHRLLSADFAAQTLAEARNTLQSELGAQYEVVVYGPYVIAAPLGQVQRWRERFSALLAGYLRYFETRGWKLRRPDFPLCVTVFATRQEFLTYTAKQVQSLPSSVVGSYFPRSNRCVLYQIDAVSSQGSTKTNWSETEATIVHEAVHQLAFNTGLHERLGMDPLWFVEGLASIFEQPNVYDPRQLQLSVESRMLPEKRQRLQPLLKQPELLLRHLEHLVAADTLFAQQPEVAYDLGWALTFYLAERRPAEFRAFTQVLASRPFGDYPTPQRIRDFRHVFGGDMSLLAAQLVRLFEM